MEIDASGRSEVGHCREINEDYFYVDNSRGLFIACDGLGGHAAGEVASHKAIEYAIEFIDEHWADVESAGNSPTGYYKLTQLIEKAIHETCRKLYSLAENEPKLQGMATTLTLLMVVDGNNESVAVETLMFEARKNDVLLLCTDGLSNYFKDDSVVAEMLSGNHVNTIADSLVQFANNSGGSDNITALVIRIFDVEDFSLNTHRIRLGTYDEVTQEFKLDGPSS